MHLWRYPSLSIHGIEGAFHEPGAKTVIPGRVIGKFSIWLAPHMDLSVMKTRVTACRVLCPRPSATHHSVGAVQLLALKYHSFFQWKRDWNKHQETDRNFCLVKISLLNYMQLQ